MDDRSSDEQALWVAVTNGRKSAAAELLESGGYEINAPFTNEWECDQTLLSAACERDNVEIANLLFQYGADANGCENVEGSLNVEEVRSVEMLTLFLQNDVDVDSVLDEVREELVKSTEVRELLYAAAKTSEQRARVEDYVNRVNA